MGRLEWDNDILYVIIPFLFGLIYIVLYNIDVNKLFYYDMVSHLNLKSFEVSDKELHEVMSVLNLLVYQFADRYGDFEYNVYSLVGSLIKLVKNQDRDNLLFIVNDGYCDIVFNDDNERIAHITDDCDYAIYKISVYPLSMGNKYGLSLMEYFIDGFNV